MNDESKTPDFLLAALRFGISLGLVRMESLMRRLGNPQDELSCIHVAGTNGKGSVTSYIGSMLAADGYRVGIYTSPFLERFSERIRVLDKKEALERFAADDSEGEIPMDVLSILSEKVEIAVGAMIADKEEHPTEFELITAIAFLYFRQMNCDFVVLETGLGGRLDSTNVIRQPVCCVITAIGYDHTDRLGETIREIAREKAGIIKKNCPVYLYSPYDTGLTEEEAKDVHTEIAEMCTKNGASLTVVSSSSLTLQNNSVDGQEFRLDFVPKPLRISLLGQYQIHNAALAVRAVKRIVSDEGIRYGLSLTRWKGRMEVLRKTPLILLDGAHNPQGARSFRVSVDMLFKEYFRQNPPRLILGFMQDKDYQQILFVLLSNLPYGLREIICVSPVSTRALPAEKLKKHIAEHFLEDTLFYKNQTTMYNSQGRISDCGEAAIACTGALASSAADGAPILCVGSLYLAGQVRKILLDS